MKNLLCVQNTPILSTHIQPAVPGTIALFENAPDGEPWFETVLSWKLEVFGVDLKESFVVVTPIGMAGELDGAHSIAHPNGMIECARSVEGRRTSISEALALGEQMKHERSPGSVLSGVARRFEQILSEARKVDADVLTLPAGAIETEYKGYKFRSRLKARWAVFFDALGIAWEYEPEGFELGDGGRFSPDFWLPFRQDGWGYWIEVNPYELTGAERDKLRALAVASGHHAYVLSGTPGEAAKISRINYDGCDCAATLLEFVALFADPAGIEKAITAARGARFEAGESGART